MDIVQFVDSISASPTVRLDLNDGSVWGLNYERTDFSPPPLDSSWAGTKLADGEIQVAAKYTNRRITLDLDLISTGPDGVAGELQKLWRELDRPFNFLKWQPQGATNPVFFRTFRSGSNGVQDYPGPGRLRTVLVGIDAKDTVLGLKETLPTVTVYNDPAEGTTLNSNPFFETDASNWSAIGGTVARSTAQFHEGVASLLLTPDGVTASVDARSELVPATAGTLYRASEWVYCAATRSVNVQINWYNAAQTFLSSSASSVSVTANTWTLLDFTATAPASTAYARIVALMGSTPLASHLLYIDEARLRQPATAGGMCFDLTGIKGDVETPLVMTLLSAQAGTQPLFCTRRRGTPSQTPLVLQAESMGLDILDTTVQTGDSTMSGGSYVRTTFATTTSLTRRLQITFHPATPTPEARGQYRVFGRFRKSVATDSVQVQLTYGFSAFNASASDPITLPQTTNTVFVDLGLISIPAAPDPHYDGYSGVEVGLNGVRVALYSGRASGSGNLDADFLLFLPGDDQFAIFDFQGPSGDLVWDGPNRTIYSIAGGGGLVSDCVPPSLVGAGQISVSPGVTNRVFFVINVKSGTPTSIANTQQIAVSYWPRYLAAKPAST